MRTSTIKSIAAIALTGVGSALVLGFKTSDELAGDSAALSNTATNGSTVASGSTRSASASGSTGTSGSATPAPTGGAGTTSGSASTAAYKDGTWTGDAVSEPWGRFQVQVVIS